MKVNMVLLSLGLIAAVGCATPYQQSGHRGGFTETRLAPDIFAISLAGNSFTSPERVSDFALLRAVEFTLNNGYNRFTLLNVARRTLDFLLPAFWQPDFQRLVSSAV
jgi:hypothetical protein